MVVGEGGEAGAIAPDEQLELVLVEQREERARYEGPQP